MIAEPVKPTYNIGGWIAIKKFCNSGFKPLPFWTMISEETGSNGFAIKLVSKIKNEKINDRNSRSARKPPKRKRITLAAPYIDKDVPKTGTKAKSNRTAGS